MEPILFYPPINQSINLLHITGRVKPIFAAKNIFITKIYRNMPKKQIDTHRLIEKLGEKPSNYPICLHLGCEHRDRCLHALESTEARMKSQIITCVNPHEYSDGRVCGAFRDRDAKARFALGMRRITSTMKCYDLYRPFKQACQRHFCRTIYYDMVAGHRIIHPTDQRVILQCAAQLGVYLPPDSFDHMVEATQW